MLFDFFEGPSHWSKRVRRIFLITFPISGPLYVIAWVPLACCAFVFFGSAVVAMDWFEWAKETWNDE